MQFPVSEIIPQLKSVLANSKCVILQAPPGAGKSTIVPLELLNEPWLNGKKTIMLEPRRLAARSVACRMADLLKEEVGNSVGYRVRFENAVSKQTRLEVVTEGILTRMLQHDNALEDVALVIFDEFHERSIHADLALALCLQSQNFLRPDLRLLIMSATLEAEKISSKIGDAPVITSEGKQFSVEIKYLPIDKNDFLSNEVARAIKKALREEQGDILVFLPGAGEINRVFDLLIQDVSDVELYPLYGDLSFKKQQEAILPNAFGKRKIVLATSIAETSLTIDGVTVVIDSGFARISKFDPRSGLSRLETVRVTRDAAYQRAGRAGRLKPGVCYRLWSNATQLQLLPARLPEIAEADLAPLMLELYNWGVKEVNELNWITLPPPGAVTQAKELLAQLEAVAENKITERGKKMALMPAHPRIAHMLLSAGNKSLLSLATDLAALLEEKNPVTESSSTDISERVSLLRKWRSNDRINASSFILTRIEKAASHWRRLMNATVDNSSFSDFDIGKLLMEAYPERIGQRVDVKSDKYKLANGRMVRLPKNDTLDANEWIVAAEMDSGTNEGKIFSAAAVKREDALLHAKDMEIIFWDEEREMVVGELQKRIGSLIISKTAISNLNDELRQPVLLQVLRDKGIRFLEWGEDFEKWQARVLSLHAWRPEEPWPEVSEEYLLRTTDEWLTPFLQNVYKRSDLKKLPAHELLNALLPWELQHNFDKLAPEKLEVPSGSMIKLAYFADGRPPVMEVRLQEVFGLTETPAVNEGRNKIIMHLLSPGYKPVQVTQDLKSFWQTTYHEVRKELRMRYPKHHWPEDPWTAEAVRGVKKKQSG
jgi:ATP-dependent helicase HrpB